MDRTVLDEDPPPGSLPDQARKYAQGNWLATQLAISLAVGLISFVTFCLVRRRAKVTYAPRTLLKGFSPHKVHDSDGLVGWILPTLRASEFTVLQIVGLDAAVVGAGLSLFACHALSLIDFPLAKLLSFYKTCFYYTLICSCLAVAILIPINYREHGSIGGVPPEIPVDPNDGYTPKRPPGSTAFLTSHLMFTYVFSLLAIYLLRRTYIRFIHSRQVFALDHAHSVPARTVFVSKLPVHLRDERELADYWESMDMGVESVTVARHVGSLSALLVTRTAKLRRLEAEWTKYIDNPAEPVPGYDPDREVENILEGSTSAATEQENPAQDRVLGQPQGDDEEARLLSSPPPMVSVPGRKRPMIRPRLFGRLVDALDYYADEFRKADEAVDLRRRARYRPTSNAFVTFERLATAQVAAQVAHYPFPSVAEATLAPEPRDVHWSNVALSDNSLYVRRVLVYMAMGILFAFWSVPVSYLASLLSYDNIKKISPDLAKLIDSNSYVRAFAMNSLPSMALVAFNALLPYFLEALCVFQGMCHFLVHCYQ
jgi:hypothetical protein